MDLRRVGICAIVAGLIVSIVIIRIVYGPLGSPFAPHITEEDWYRGLGMPNAW